MENFSNNMDIFYQINIIEEIKEPSLKQTKQNPYFLIECKNKKITYNCIIDSLKNDGVNMSQISEIRYLTETEKNYNIRPKPLSETNFYKIKNKDKLYLHLILEEETETPEELLILDEMEDYNINIEKKEKEFESIYNSLKKQEIYDEKILSDNMFKQIEKNHLYKEIDINEFRDSKTVIGRKYPTKKVSDSLLEVLEEDFSTEDLENINLDLSQKNINQIMSANYFKDESKKSNKSLTYIKMKSENINFKKGNNIFHLCYLYSNPLLDKNNIKKDFQDNDCFNDILNIYNIFQKSNVQSNLKFEPVIDDFNVYFQAAPDILHININSNCDKKTRINLDYKGELRAYPCNDLKVELETEQGVGNIKLLILSTQNYNKMKTFFNNKGIKNIIYVENSINYPEPNEQVESFIKDLYENLIIHKRSVQESFKISRSKVKGNFTAEIYPALKNEKKNDFLFEQINSNNLDNNLNIEENTFQQFFSQKIIHLKDNKNKIKLNENCSLNLDFIKNNYRRIIGRNFELKNCINNIDRYDSVCVLAFPGAGKKSFIQTVGKFAFERKMYQEVRYLEIYYIRNADGIISNTKKEISKKLKLDEDNQLEYNDKKILLIINLNYVISEENDAPIFEEVLHKYKDKYFNYLFAFTISGKIPFKNIRMKLRTPIIELNKLDEQKRKNLLYSISYNLKCKNLVQKKDEDLVKKNTFGYPNEIYLKTMYINLFSEEFNNIDFDKLTNEVIFNKLIEKFGEKMIKILSIFSISKLGIRDDIKLMFFTEDEIKFIDKEINYLILQEIDNHGKIYYLDDSFRNIIIKILLEKHKKYFLIYLNLLLKNYAIIFRYLVNYSNYQYNIAFEFHAGINKGFWFSVKEKGSNEPFLKEYEDFKRKNHNIYFDQTIYYINVLFIFNIQQFVDMINKNIDIFSEYTSQISICLPTILYFENNIIYLSRISELFKERLGFLDLKISRLRLRLFIYWFSEQSNLIPNIKEIFRLEKELKAEIILVIIYDAIKKKDKQSIDLSEIYSDYFGYCKNNNFNISKLNLLYGNLLKNKDCLSYYKLARKYAEEDDNIYMKLLSFLLEAEYYLEKNDFDQLNDIITKCEKEIRMYEAELINTDIKKIIYKIKKDKDEKYKFYTKYKLFFFDSNPLFDNKGNPLKTESNNSFYLKYNLITKLPKYLQIEFKNINEEFTTNLEKCLLNPIRFLYIGSDQYNEEGDLFYTKDFQSYPCSKKSLKEIFGKVQNKCEIVILGFLNSEKISEYLIKNKFPNVIFIKKINELNKLFKIYPYYYFYFQRCFYVFITEFLLILSKKHSTIKEAYAKANNAFVTKFGNIFNFCEDKELKEKINQIIILKGEQKKDEEVFYDFDDDNNNNSFSSSSGSLLNLGNADSKSSFDNVPICNNELYENINEIDENKEINKEKDKKFIEFFKFPKEGLKDEIFEKIYGSRLYGRKEILKTLINNLLKFKCINLYGDLSCGKTYLCWELCKYFYMNDYFKDGIFYINANKQNKITGREDLKPLINKNNNNNCKINDVLLIFDDFDLIKKKLYSYINKLNSYTIFITKTKDVNLLNEYYMKRNNNKISNDEIYINLDKNLCNKFAEEFFNYLAVLHNLPDKKFNINELIDINEKKLSIKNIVSKIKDIEGNKIKRKNYSLSSSQIIFKKK